MVTISNKPFLDCPLSDYVCRPAPQKEKTTLEKVENMRNDPLTQALAQEHGMSVQTVSWEDSARTKNSCWGPNISDMTLQVKDEIGKYHRMPVIRQPNFSDKTHDVSLDKFSVLVGNEKGNGELTSVSLKEYLAQFSQYISNGAVTGSLLSERDQHAIHSVQACFLPAAVGEEVNFNVALYNYQSYKGNPAVLTIVASSHGTSAQIIDNGDNWEGQKLTFDQKGKSCDFVASRLQDVREQEGRVSEVALTRQEEANRKLLIIQIPLKVAPRQMRFDDVYLESCCMERSVTKSCIDDAQIKIGKEGGDFTGLKDLTIERDERYPIRVTTQIYKVTDNGTIDREQMEKIAAEIKKEEAIGQNGSSLVLEQTQRPTEWKNPPVFV